MAIRTPQTTSRRSRLVQPVEPGSLVIGAEDALPGEAVVLRAAERSLSGERRGIRRYTPFLGPAFIASVAYVDPGNFATNMAGGAKFGYLLLWVVLVANLMAMLIQSMSAKLGIATGMNLPEVCRERFSRRVDVRALGAGRADRDGHRHRRVRRRRDRHQPADRPAALPGRPPRRRRCLLHPRPAEPWLPQVRGRDRLRSWA